MRKRRVRIFEADRPQEEAGEGTGKGRSGKQKKEVDLEYVSRYGLGTGGREFRRPGCRMCPFRRGGEALAPPAALPPSHP